MIPQPLNAEFEEVDEIQLGMGDGDWLVYAVRDTTYEADAALRVKSIGIAQRGPFLLVRLVYMDGKVRRIIHRGPCYGFVEESPPEPDEVDRMPDGMKEAIFQKDPGPRFGDDILDALDSPGGGE